MQFYDRNESALEGEKDKLEKQAAEWGNTAPMLYLRSGTTMLRILPPYSDAGVFFREVIRHRIRVNNRTELFLCPAAMANTTCPICVMGQEYTDSHDEAKMKYASENLRPQTKYLYNVICYSGPANPKNGEMPEFGKVYVMEGGVMVHRQIISLDQDPATGWADITNPSSGVNLIIKRTGQGFDTKYEVNPHGGGRSDIFADLQARQIDPNSLALINLDEVGAVPAQDKLEGLLVGLGVPSSATVAPTPLPVVSPQAPPAAGPPIQPVPITTPAPVVPTPIATPTPTAAPLPGSPPGATMVAPPVQTQTAAAAPAVNAAETPTPVAAPIVPPPPTQEG
jgi:hypothetical protein